MCDLEVINEKLFQSISQSVNEENGDREFNKACTEKMKELLANALVEQEERVVSLAISILQNKKVALNGDFEDQKVSKNLQFEARELLAKLLWVSKKWGSKIGFSIFVQGQN